MASGSSGATDAGGGEEGVRPPSSPARFRRWLRPRVAAEPPDETAQAQLVLLATVCAAFITVAAVLLLTAWAYATATGSTDLSSPDVDPVFEDRDTLVWLAALLAAASLGLLLAWVRLPARRLLESWPVVGLTVAGTAGVVTSAAWFDPWVGLDTRILLLAVVLVPVLIWALGPRARGALRYVWPVVAAVYTALYLPALWLTPYGLYDDYHSPRNFDELLGPVAGNLPLSDYIPQYGGLLGLPLVPFRSLVAGDVEWWVVSYTSVLGILTVGALCVAAALMLPTGRRVLAPLLVVPVPLMKPSLPDQLLPAGTVRLVQSIPERSLLPAVLGVALLLAASRPRSPSRWAWVGAVAGLAALHNVVSGVPATVAAVLALVALHAGWRTLGCLAAGWVGVVVAYVALLHLAGGSFRLEYWVGFIRLFADGYGQLPMPAYGPHVLVIFVLVASVASAFAVAWRRSASLSVAAVGGLYFGAWGLMMLPYYVGRSSNAAQLLFFLIPASVAAVWLLIGAARAMQGPRSTPRLAGAALLCCLPAALFASTVTKAPSPELSFTRLSGGFGLDSEFRSAALARRAVVDDGEAQVIRDLSAGTRAPVGLFFASGNVASLRTSLPNASILAAPEELTTQRPRDDPGTAAFRRLQCRSLEASGLNSVIADELFADALDSCTGFSRGRRSTAWSCSPATPREAGRAPAEEGAGSAEPGAGDRDSDRDLKIT